ncbi:MAG: linear amide C-N hydrolase [Bacteriovoracia bacterium]
MKILFFASILALLLFCLPLSPAQACSAFGSGGGGAILMGKSYDWSMPQGLIYTNKRNVQKKAMSLDPSRPTDFSWISKYGSLTFNQYGRELPNGGMNEKGLAIEVLWLNSAEYPAEDSRVGLNEGQWIQYHLDTYASVKEMAENADKLRTNPVFAKVHHLACDASGECAVFENIAGKLVITRGEDGALITNSTSASSRKYRRGFSGFGGRKEIPEGSYRSEDRFVTLSHLRKQFSSIAAPRERLMHAFRMLSAVRSQETSVWNIVYDFSGKSVSFKFLPAGQAVRSLPLADVDFSCLTPVRYVDLSATDSQWKNYDAQKNFELVKRGMEENGSHLPNAELITLSLAKYPETTKCQE